MVSLSDHPAHTLRQAQGERGGVLGKGHLAPPLMVSLSDHPAHALRQAQGERGGVLGKGHLAPPLMVSLSDHPAHTLRQAQGERGDSYGLYATPSPSMGEGWGEGEIPLPVLPTCRGNPCGCPGGRAPTRDAPTTRETGTLAPVMRRRLAIQKCAGLDTGFRRNDGRPRSW